MSADSALVHTPSPTWLALTIPWNSWMISALLRNGIGLCLSGYQVRFEGVAHRCEAVDRAPTEAVHPAQQLGGTLGLGGLVEGHGRGVGRRRARRSLLERIGPGPQ